MSSFCASNKIHLVLGFCCLALVRPACLQAVNIHMHGTPVAWGGNVMGQTNVTAGLTNIVAVAAGAYHGLALKADGKVVGWGYSGWGQATAPAGLSGVVDIAAGYGHSLALKSNGTVVAWGDGSAGQTNVPAGLLGVAAIAAGDYHNLALTSDGHVVAWGANNYGQSSVPAIYYPVVAIAAGGNHSLALLNNGNVIGWGLNTSGQAESVGPGITNIAAGGNFSLGITSSGVVGGWGDNFSGQISPPALPAVIAIAAGNNHSLAIKNDRRVAAWGDNTQDQATVPPGLTNIMAISAGYFHSVALMVRRASIVTQPQSRTVLAGSNVSFTVSGTGSAPMFYQWLFNGAAIPNATSPTFSIAAVTPAHAGTYTVLVGNPLGYVTSAGAVLTVVTPPLITSEPQSCAVGVGATVSFSVTATGTAPLAYRWRLNGANLAATATNSNYAITNVQLSHAGNYTVVLTNKYGKATSEVAVLTVHPLPSLVTQPQSQSVLPGSSVSFHVSATNATSYQWQKDGVALSDATSPSYSINNVGTEHAGNYQVCVSNAYGGIISSNAALSLQTFSGIGNRKIIHWGEQYVWNGAGYVNLTPPAGLADAVAISSGLRHTLVLRQDGTVVGWGDNSLGQATPPYALSTVQKIAAGGYHSLALREDGTVVAWGANDFSQTTVPSPLTNVVQIAAGGFHSLALKNDGTVSGWGKSASGQTIPSPLVGNSNLLAIAAGLEHSLGLRSNSTVVAWGNNDYYQSRVPQGLSNVLAVSAGDRHSMALRANGTVLVWGDNTFGQTNVPAGLSDVVAIACGANHCLALKRNGTVAGWGQDNFGQIDTSALTGIAALSAGGGHSVALKKMLIRFGPLQRKANGTWRLSILNEDGSAPSPDMVSYFTLHSSTNLLMNPNSWPGVPGLVYTNGALYLDITPNSPRRFYMGLEQ